MYFSKIFFFCCLTFEKIYSRFSCIFLILWEIDIFKEEFFFWKSSQETSAKIFISLRIFQIFLRIFEENFPDKMSKFLGKIFHLIIANFTLKNLEHNDKMSKITFFYPLYIWSMSGWVVIWDPVPAHDRSGIVTRNPHPKWEIHLYSSPFSFSFLFNKDIVNLMMFFE